MLAWFPDDVTLLGGLLGLIGLFGGAIGLAQIARDRGKRLQSELFKRWGGAPSVLILRHRDCHINPNTKKRYHEVLAEMIPSLRLPTAKEEEEDPTGADSVYESCSDYLREKTRSATDFPLLLSENVNFGTRRNLLGLKPIGIVLCLLALGSDGVVLLLRYPDQVMYPIIGSLVTFILLLLWILKVTPNWIRSSAFAYSERLLASCETLSQKITKI